jgi:hypothetical protein
MLTVRDCSQLLDSFDKNLEDVDHFEQNGVQSLANVAVWRSVAIAVVSMYL